MYGGMQWCKRYTEGCIEAHRWCGGGCMKVCRRVHTGAWICMEVHRGCAKMARGAYRDADMCGGVQRCIEGCAEVCRGAWRYMEMG